MLTDWVRNMASVQQYLLSFCLKGRIQIQILPFTLTFQCDFYCVVHHWRVQQGTYRKSTGNPPIWVSGDFSAKKHKLVVFPFLNWPSVELEIQLIWSFARNPFWKSSAAGSWLLHHWRTKWYDSSLFLKDYENSSNRHSFGWDSMIIITTERNCND